MRYSFLMIGQSNMAGRGKWDEVEPIPHEGRLLMLRNGRFIGLSEPVNCDRAFAECRSLCDEDFAGIPPIQTTQQASPVECDDAAIRAQMAPLPRSLPKEGSPRKRMVYAKSN